MTTKTEDFCRSILQLPIESAKPLANLVMALASYSPAHSVVGLSQSALYHYQYSSIAQTIRHLAKDHQQLQQVQRLINRHAMRWIPPQTTYSLTSDTTPLLKPHAPTLEGRGFVHVSNTHISGNKPIDIGFSIATVVLQQTNGWVLPLSMERVGPQKTPSQQLCEQLKTLLDDAQLPFAQAACIIHRADSHYSHAAFLSPTYAHDQLINVVRLRAGQRVWKLDPRPQTGGRPARYAPTPHYLIGADRQHVLRRKGQEYSCWQASLLSHPPCQQAVVEQTTAKGRSYQLRLRLWQNWLLKGSKEHLMSDKPINVLALEATDTKTGQALFEEPMFIGVSGRRKDQLTPQQVWQQYDQRYDIEPFFRFSKQRLFLARYQTSSTQHLDNWLVVVELAVWLLWLTAQEAPKQTLKWQHYLAVERLETPVLGLAQAYRSAEVFFLTFESRVYYPQKWVKGKPRELGYRQAPRKRYEVIRKKAKPPT